MAGLNKQILVYKSPNNTTCVTDCLIVLCFSVQEEQRRALEKEAQAKQQQQQQQVKLAPWAKKTQHDSGSRDLVKFFIFELL